MKYIYFSMDSAEAHMIVHRLGQEGIQGFIQGEEMVGFIGVASGPNPIKIGVIDEDYEAAHALLRQWEEEQPPAE